VTPAIDTDLLPPLLQELVALIGLTATMKLVERYGGVRLYVPKRAPDQDHELVQLIGTEAVSKLVAAYGGEVHFDVPLAQRALRAVRSTQIRIKRATCSVRELALEYRTTERNIRLICNDDDDDRQPALF
jgi:Mor family transcriptional regulator